MNKEIETCAKKLNQAILDEPLVKEYKKYKEELEAHPEFLKQEAQLKDLQKQIIQTKDRGEDTSFLEKEYNTLKDAYFSHPIINNYMVLKEELDDFLTTTNHTINQYLQDESSS